MEMVDFLMGKVMKNNKKENEWAAGALSTGRAAGVIALVQHSDSPISA